MTQFPCETISLLISYRYPGVHFSLPIEACDRLPTCSDVKEAIDAAEEIVKDVPEKRPSENDEYPPLSTYAMEEDLITHKGRKKKGKKKSGKANIQPQGKLQG